MIHRLAIGLLAVGLATLALLAGGVWGFSSQASSLGNELKAAPDWVPPAVRVSRMQKTEGGTTGYIRTGAPFRVLADVSDGGQPSSGIASVNLSVTGLSPIPLSPASTTTDGDTYNYRSDPLTFSVSAGTYPFTIVAVDGAGNSRPQATYTVIVDNTAPSANDVKTANKVSGGIAGRPEIGDSVTMTYNEPIDPPSIAAGWTTTTTSNVVVRISDNASSGRDLVTIYNAANTIQLPLGRVDLGRSDYVIASRTFGATGTPSTMTMSGNSISVTLGTASGTTTTAAAGASMIWTPMSGATDRAGNGASVSPYTEIGTVDREF